MVIQESTFSEKLQHSCKRELEMDCHANDAFEAIFNLRDWPIHLPHVPKVDVLYDDGQYQEFIMEVISSPQNLRVRSIRNCKPEEMEITFFQPEPPPYLLHHCGGWHFEDLGENHCRVYTWHYWNLKPEVASLKFPPTSQKTTEEQIEDALSSHAELALKTWKTILER